MNTTHPSSTHRRGPTRLESTTRDCRSLMLVALVVASGALLGCERRGSDPVPPSTGSTTTTPAPGTTTAPPMPMPPASAASQ